jgi:hypothetical protein
MVLAFTVVLALLVSSGAIAKTRKYTVVPVATPVSVYEVPTTFDIVV